MKSTSGKVHGRMVAATVDLLQVVACRCTGNVEIQAQVLPPNPVNVIAKSDHDIGVQSTRFVTMTGGKRFVEKEGRHGGPLKLQKSCPFRP